MSTVLNPILLAPSRPVRTRRTGSATTSAVEPEALAATDIDDRVRWAAEFRRNVANRQSEFLRTVSAETGKPEFEVLMGDVAPLLAACRWLERNARRVLRERRVPRAGRAPWQVGSTARVMREPLGKVAIIATWNYPVQLLGVQLAHAVVGGNAVVVKPSERSPRSQSLLLDCAESAGLPRGLIKRYPATREAGAEMLDSEHPDHVVFTGSTAVGRQVAAWCAANLVPSTLELSGVDSAFVLRDADPALAARTIWHAATMNAGQTCIAPRRVLVERPVYERFLAALAPFAASAKRVRVIDERAAARAYELAAEAISLGGRSLSGVAEPPAGRLLTPLAIVDCPPDAPLAHTEHFAPMLAVVPVENAAEALAIHVRCGQHLAASVFGRDRGRTRGLAAALGCGTVCLNDCVLPVSLPGVGLGGRGLSGWGASRGEEGLLAMTRPVYVTATSRWLRPPTDLPTPAQAARLSRFIRWWYSR